MEYIVLTGDMATFETTAGSATVTLSPVPITGSGKIDVGGKKICIDGDETTVQATGTYINAAYVGGTCSAKIKALDSSQKATKFKSKDKAAILATGKFDVEITVLVPALMPGSPPTPDPTPQYSGKGSFITTNTKLKAS